MYDFVNISRGLTVDDVWYLYHKASGIQLCKILSISAKVLQLMMYGTCIIKRLEYNYVRYCQYQQRSYS